MSEVVVTAPARLHFGMLDPAGLGARRFGGFGVGVESPRVVVGVSRGAGDAIVVSGAQAERAAMFARRARTALALSGGLEISVHEAIPPHSGLGSGTKLGLAIARGVAEVHGVGVSPEQLAEATGRGARSSVGCWTFVAPGLVVEAGVLGGGGGVSGGGAGVLGGGGGVSGGGAVVLGGGGGVSGGGAGVPGGGAGVSGGGGISPEVARHPMPARWRCVLAVPRGGEGLSGDAEERFFTQLTDRAAAEPRVSRLLLTSVLPGLLAGDIDEFGQALSEIQREVGSVFAEQQGGVFHPLASPLIDALSDLGVGAVGQSSWGPSVYGIVDGPDRAADVAERLQAAVGAAADVRAVDFDRQGAFVARGGAGQAAA